VIIYSTDSVSRKEFSMKNVLRAFGIIAIVAVIGFSFAACGGDDSGGGGKDSLDGTTWKGTTGGTVLITFKSPNYSASIPSNPEWGTATGTYTISSKFEDFLNGETHTDSSGNLITRKGYRVTVTSTYTPSGPLSGMPFNTDWYLCGNTLYIPDGHYGFPFTKQ
jgi:hypothetical protein